MDDNLIEEYISIRNTLYSQVKEMCSIFLTGLWDPMLKHIMIKETQELIRRQLTYDYPNFPAKYLPKTKIKMDENEMTVEAGIQVFINTDTSLYFLGNIEHGGIEYDLYCQKSLDPYFSYIFYARYGHDEDQVEMGSKEPAAEYMMGIMTPLSIAYSFAVDEGYID